MPKQEDKKVSKKDDDEVEVIKKLTDAELAKGARMAYRSAMKKKAEQEAKSGK